MSRSLLFLKIITPLRLVAISLLIWAISEKLEGKIGGLGPTALIFGAIIVVLVDIILSMLLKAKVNWKVQVVILFSMLLWI